MSKNTANVEVNAKRPAKKNAKNVEAEQPAQVPAKEEQKVVADAPQKRGGRAKKTATSAEQPATAPAPAKDVKVAKKAGKAEAPAKAGAEVEAPAPVKADAKSKAPAKAAAKAPAKAQSKEQTKEQSKSKSASKGKGKAVKADAKAETKSAPKNASKKSKKDEVVEEAVQEPTQADEQVDAEGDSAESKFEKLMTSLSDTRKNIAELQKQEKILIKKLSNVHVSELKKASRRKRKPNDTPTGFATEKDIGGKLADWLRVERGTKMTGPALSKAFWARIREDGLQYAENKRVLRTNKEVSAIFGVDAKVNKSVDPADEKGFNMRTYQTHIAYALEHNNQ